MQTDGHNAPAQAVHDLRKIFAVVLFMQPVDRFRLFFPLKPAALIVLHALQPCFPPLVIPVGLVLIPGKHFSAVFHQGGARIHQPWRIIPMVDQIEKGKTEFERILHRESFQDVRNIQASGFPPEGSPVHLQVVIKVQFICSLLFFQIESLAQHLSVFFP